LEPDWLGGRWAPLAGACGDRRRSGEALSAVWWWWWSRRERRRQVGAVILMGRIPFADRWLHTGGEAQQQQLEACRWGPLVSGTGSSSSASQHERGSGRKINRAMMTVAVRTCTERGSGRWIGEGATGPPVRHRAPPRAFLESFLFTGASGFLS
jgi:hypothetical protein